MSQKRVAHLIGNGPSKEFFENNPKGEVYGCNFGTEGIDHKAVFIHDRRVMRHILTHTMRFDTPIILREKYTSDAKRAISLKLVKEANLTYLPGKIRTRNSGHDGMVYLLKYAPEKYEELHLWGFDSLTTGMVDSDSKGKIDGSNPRQTMVPRWISFFSSWTLKMKEKGKIIILHHNSTKAERVA
jgi:hypothetical protein